MRRADRLPAKVLLVAVLWAVSGPAPAGALVLCKGPNATIVARAACKKKEIRLDAATVGAPGDRGAPGPGLVVVDKNGKVVGPVVGEFVQFEAVFREIDGLPFLFDVTASGFFRPAETEFGLYYPDAECAGPKLVTTQPAVTGLFANFLLFSVDGRTGYYGLQSEQGFLDEKYAIEVASGIDDADAANDCTMTRHGKVVKSAHDCVDPRPPDTRCVLCCAPVTAGALSPAHTIDVTALGLTPPFRLQPR